MSNRINPAFTEDMFRPVYEANISAVWAAGAIITPLTGAASIGVAGLGVSGIMAGIMGACSLYWAAKSVPRIKKHVRLHLNKRTFIDERQLRRLHKLPKRIKGSTKVERDIYIGDGFEWGNEHSNRAYTVMDFDSKKSDVKIPLPLRIMLHRRRKVTRTLGGSPWIQGLGDEIKVMVREESMFGHGVIFGGVGTGKTTLLRLLSVGFLHLGNVMLVLDPKNDPQWKDVIVKEMEYLGLKDRFFHVQPANPSKSARFPFLKRYSRISEIADRVAPLMGGEGSSKGFQDFAYSVIYAASLALEYNQQPVSLVNIKQSITIDGRYRLALDVFQNYYEEKEGSNWKDKLQASLDEYGNGRLEQMANYYFAKMRDKHGREEVCEAIWELASHPEDHYVKMIVTLRPIFNALTAAPMDDIFSPVEDWSDSMSTSKDTRPIVDIDDLLEHGGCIYVSLDSLSDANTAGYLSRLLMAECAAAAGRRYNTGQLEPQQVRRVTVMNDEVQASIENNDAMMQLLAMGRQSQFQLILATQTRSDVISKMSNPAAADRFLGLTNNFFTMRTTDPATQEYAAKQFNKTSITTLQSQSSQNTDTASSVLQFTSSTGVRAMKMREDAFPEALFGDIPVLQYVCKLADGRKLKMRLPIFIHKSRDRLAPWVGKE